MSLSPALIDALLNVQRRAQAAGHGGKEAVYAAACEHLGYSRATLMRRLKEVTVQPERKRRNDAGKTSLTLPDAQRLSAQMMEGYRANDKSIQALKLSLEQLRAENPLFASVIDADTGETRQLSESACARALRGYALHPEQLRAPAPVQALASDHPNDVWQIDASISTLFYVPGERESGMQDMAPGVFYKNKPENFERIKRQRLTRYVLTDHCSGSIFVLYVPGGESTVNMAESFLAAIAQRPGQQMYGVPFHLMMDPGSAGIGGTFMNLLRRLQVTPVVNKAGNARAKGQVENAHNLVETNFESGFKFTHVPSIEWINEKAQMWMRHYNSARTHSRHGMTRWAKWLEITQQQLRLVDATLARALLTREPVTPKVDRELTVRFDNRVWNVRDVPGVMVGGTVEITYNPFDQATAYVIQHDSEGQELLIPVPEAQEGAHGFAASAARIAREMKSLPDTVAVTNRKLVERLATGTDSDDSAAAARKAKALPFGGKHDPYAHHEPSLPAAVPLPRRGTELETATRVAQAEPELLTHFEAAKALVSKGVAMSPELVGTLKSLHPEGVPEAELDALVARLTVRAGLRVVGGAQ
ncbi:transposase [Acidovorax sp. SUPP2825]|uniref:transposase n=1 Tax=Acidovorax sp. SUPP2825 TaxID=2920879 RepID=UPI0023DE20A2|nr:transposase [Acidovorax sp. SUPP2825]GKS97009.1 DDE-type integrase/transposase/recombinase [Acidovorax sp. SUPP2825]